MSKLKFSKEDIDKLKDNPYILNISEKAITYTDEFKEKYMDLYNKGKKPTEIFRLCEIPPEIIGRKRIDTFAYRLKKKYEYGEELTDKRKEFSDRPKSKELTKDEEIQRLKHKIQYQEQQIEFLKKVSRSGFYSYRNRKMNPSQKEIQDRENFELILKAYTHRGYNKGSRNIKMYLEHNKIIMSRSKIQRLMNKFGLFCPIRKANPARRIAKAIKTNNYVDNLVNRNFKDCKPREILLTDITYLIYNNGKRAYLSTIKDAKTNEILAYALSESLEMSIVEQTIERLLEKHGLTLTSKTIIHSDQGAHYTSIRFKELLKENNWLQSMSRRGNCWDNAPQESFYGHMKDEIDISTCKNFNDIKLIIDDYMDYYNTERYQWNLAKLSPNEYYEYLITGIYPLKNDNRNN